jgi:prophage maintenance system killer protein
VAINQRFSNGLTATGDVSTVLANAERHAGFFNKSASIIRDIAGRHLFSNGNKRTAHAVVTELMNRNNILSGPTSAELYSVIGKVARGELRGIPDIASALRGF